MDHIQTAVSKGLRSKFRELKNRFSSLRESIAKQGHKEEEVKNDTEMKEQAMCGEIVGRGVIRGVKGRERRQ